MQIPNLYIAETSNGRGVFTAGPIEQGSVIEVCHVIVIPAEELPIIHRTHLHDYYFLWGADMDQCAIALGYGSLYNHMVHPNANFILDLANNTVDIEAVKDILPGEEITINYHGAPGDEAKLWF